MLACFVLFDHIMIFRSCKILSLLLQSRMEDRLDDAIHVLRNHAEPVIPGGHPLDASRLTQPPSSHSNELLFTATNGLTFSTGLTASGQLLHSAVCHPLIVIMLCGIDSFSFSLVLCAYILFLI